MRFNYLGAALVVGATPAYADVLYLDEKLNEALRRLGEYSIRHHSEDVVVGYTTMEVPRMRGNTDIPPAVIRTPVKETRTSVIKGALTVQGAIDVLESNIILDNPNKSGLPDSFKARSVVIRNCTSGSQNFTATINLRASVSEQITNTTQIQKSRTDNISGGLTLNFGKIGGDMKGSRQWNRSITTTQAEASSENEEVTENYAMPLTVKSMTIQSLTGRWSGSQVHIPWSATFVIDANLAPNLDGKMRASDVLPAKERTVSTTGLLKGFEIGEIAISFEEIALDKEYCDKIPSEQKFEAVQGLSEDMGQ